MNPHTTAVHEHQAQHETVLAIHCSCRLLLIRMVDLLLKRIFRTSYLRSCRLMPQDVDLGEL